MWQEVLTNVENMAKVRFTVYTIQVTLWDDGDYMIEAFYHQADPSILCSEVEWREQISYRSSGPNAGLYLYFVTTETFPNTMLDMKRIQPD